MCIRDRCTLVAVVPGAVESERGDVAFAAQQGGVGVGVVTDVEFGVDRDGGLVNVRVAQLECLFTDAGEVAGVRRGALVGTGAAGHVLVAGPVSYTHLDVYKRQMQILRTQRP